MRYGIVAVNSLLIDDSNARRDICPAAEDLGCDFLTLIDHVLPADPASSGPGFLCPLHGRTG